MNKSEQMKRFAAIFLCVIFTTCLAQARGGDGKHNQLKGSVVKAVVVNGDTVPVVTLREVVISTEMIFASEEAAKKYRLLVRDVRRVYPYAILLSTKVKDFDRQMASMSRREKKDFIKKNEPALKAQFEAAFRSNTADQAQVLIKLIDRESGQNSYHLLKQFKGGLNAFMWQSVARVVGTNLKAEYDADGEDKAIEHIVRQIESGLI